MTGDLDIKFSSQAELLLAKMPEVKKEEIINWFLHIRKILIGGGDVVDFLDYLKKQNTFPKNTMNLSKESE